MSWDAVTARLQQNIAAGKAPDGLDVYEAIRGVEGIAPGGAEQYAAYMTLPFAGLKGRLVWEFRHSTRHNIWLGSGWGNALDQARIPFEEVRNLSGTSRNSGRPRMVDHPTKGFGGSLSLKLVVRNAIEAKALAKVLSRSEVGLDRNPDATASDLLATPPKGKKPSSGTVGFGSPSNADSEYDLIAGALARLASEYGEADIEQREIVLKRIERGPAGNLVKKANGYRCQLCEALGLNPIGFTKSDGQPYVEAHHITPVSSLESGSLSPSNIVTLCANHHRQMHHGNVNVKARDEAFDVVVDGVQVSLRRHMVG